MKTRTTETKWTGPLTWRIVAAAPILLVAAPFWFAGNGLAMLASCVAGKNIAYSWETDVEAQERGDKPGEGWEVQTEARVHAALDGLAREKMNEIVDAFEDKEPSK